MNGKFFTQRFYLDVPLNRAENRGGAHYVGPFKSFWVSAASRTDIECDLVIDPRSDMGRGLPLRLNQCQSIKGKAEEACLESLIAQPGDWIEITFAQDDEISVGSVVIDLSGEVSTIDGKSHESLRLDLPIDVITEIFPSSDTRIVDSLQCKSGGVFWIGKDSPAELQNPDWKNICHKVVLSPDENFEWRNKSALHARSDVSASVFSIMREKVSL